MAGAVEESRITRRFANLKKHRRPGLITFITANDPTPGAFQLILEGMPSAGADIIEIGMPFSDPMADGPAIQASNQRALRHRTKISDILESVKKFRDVEPETPIVLMGYYNPIYRYGAQEFAQDASAAGVDGVIVVDLPPEEAEELNVHLRANDMHMIFLTAPTSDDERLPAILKHASGFLYYVSITGITGTKVADEGAIKDAVTRLRKQTALPIAVGFGIRNPERAAGVAAHCDAVVVGSAIVEIIAKGVETNGMPSAGLSGNVLNFVKSLATSVHKSWP
jgi:tryptophan synthase alpha chain